MRTVLATAAATAASLVLWPPCVPPLDAAEFFAANTLGWVSVHHTTDSGDTPPRRLIAGPATGLGTIFGVAFDANRRELYVASVSHQRVVVFPHDADGDVPPIRTIEGPATQLVSPIGLAYDPNHDELFVRNLDGTTILVFRADADGNVAPIRVIAGTATEIQPGTLGLALDPVNDELAVASRDAANGSGTILVFPRDAVGNVPPIRRIRGPELADHEPYGILVDTKHDEYLVTLDDTGGVVAYPRTADGTNVAPSRHLFGSETGLWNPAGLYLDHREDILVIGGQSSDQLWIYARTAAGHTPPLRTIEGSSTNLRAPRMIAGPQPIVFRDGFETGTTALWSASAP